VNQHDVIVIGGGLSSQGRRVLVLEQHKVLGGRTSSWIEDGMPVECGLHRFLGFYQALPALLRKAGVDPDEILFWEEEAEIRLPDGRPRGVLGASPLHKPMKTIAGAIGNNRLISPRDKATLTRFFAVGVPDGGAGRPLLTARPSTSTRAGMTSTTTWSNAS
jgi:15-cis-phytoene desaturase